MLAILHPTGWTLFKWKTYFLLNNFHYFDNRYTHKKLSLIHVLSSDNNRDPVICVISQSAIEHVPSSIMYTVWAFLSFVPIDFTHILRDYYTDTEANPMIDEETLRNVVEWSTFISLGTNITTTNSIGKAGNCMHSLCDVMHMFKKISSIARLLKCCMLIKWYWGGRLVDCWNINWTFSLHYLQ